MPEKFYPPGECDRPTTGRNLQWGSPTLEGKGYILPIRKSSHPTESTVLPLAASTTAEPGQPAFSASIVAWCCDYVAATVTSLIRLEMIERLRTTSRQRAVVSMMRVEAVIHMAMETRPAVEPRSYTYKYAASKPIRPVVPIRSTVIRRVIEISIWTDGRSSDIHAYRDL